MISADLINRFIQVDSQQIDGWFFPADMLAFVAIDHVQSALSVQGHLCEVGVYKAKSLVLLSHLAKPDRGERLFGFDLFPDDLRGQAEAVLDRFGSPCPRMLVASDTAALTRERLAEIFPSGLRILHIDAGHEYHEVFHQVITFAPYLLRGGVIIFDDYQDREFPGIEAAVLDFCEQDRPRRFVPFFAGANKMYCCETELAPVYQKHLLGVDFINSQCRLTQVRDFQILVGWSKLPLPPEQLLAHLESGVWPQFYELDQDALAQRAASTAQLQMAGPLLVAKPGEQA